ncbi:MAG: hypothetical protein RLZZ628_4181 [Bacteroidota bacterium]|jgi:RNA polymerase sigma factor (sigma-70 family)
MRETGPEKNFGLDKQQFTQMIAAFKQWNSDELPYNRNCPFFTKIYSYFNHFVGLFKALYNPKITFETIQDRVQEGYIKFYEALRAEKVEYDNLSGYLYNTIHNTILDTCRKKTLIVDTLSLDVLQIAAPHIKELEGIYERCREKFDEILQKFKATNPMHFELIHRHYFDNIKLKDIAELWKVTPEAVRKRHQAASKKLREAVDAFSLKLFKTLLELLSD